MELIQSYRDIETILENIDRKKYTVPENWNYQVARELFITPDIQDPQEVDLKWTEPDEEGLVKFLCGDRQFSEDRVRSGAKKIFKSKNTQTQGRLDGFFKVLPSTNTPKRKAEPAKSTASGKKAKAATGAGRGRRPK